MSDENEKRQLAKREQQAVGPSKEAGSLQDLLNNPLQHMTPEQKAAVSAQIASETVRLQALDKELTIKGEHGARLMDKHVEAAETLRGGKLEVKDLVGGSRLKTEIDMGAGKSTLQTKTGPCFVATAAYGDGAHPDVVYLREYRDRVLTSTSIGRIAIVVYSWIGPVAARFVLRRPKMQELARAGISALVRWMRRHR